MLCLLNYSRSLQAQFLYIIFLYIIYFERNLEFKALTPRQQLGALDDCANYVLVLVHLLQLSYGYINRIPFVQQYVSPVYIPLTVCLLFYFLFVFVCFCFCCILCGRWELNLYFLFVFVCVFFCCILCGRWELNLLLSCLGLSSSYSCNRWPSPPAWHPSSVVQAHYFMAGVS